MFTCVKKLCNQMIDRRENMLKYFATENGDTNPSARDAGMKKISKTLFNARSVDI